VPDGQLLPLSNQDCTNLDCASLDCLIETAINQNVFPGAVALISYQGNVIYHKAFGHQTYTPPSAPITTDTLFDIASLTKPIATTTAAMLLHDRGQLDLNAPVCHYLPEFGNNGKEKICIKHLLTHTSGLDAGAVPFPHEKGWQEIRHDLMQQRPLYPLELLCVYSDIGFIILQQIIEKITHMPLDEFCTQQIFEPLGMANTSFNPLARFAQKAYAPTVLPSDPLGRTAGIVNDEKALQMGGVAGHAGLFSTASDLARFMHMMMRKGIYQTTLGTEQQFILPTAIDQWTQQQCQFKRGYGWELGRHLAPHAFGHFGWTGTSMWADREQDLFCIILTNRAYTHNHANSLPRMTQFRLAFHDSLASLAKRSLGNTKEQLHKKIIFHRLAEAVLSTKYQENSVCCHS
jgi:CubicO group peptidase (beta-lactamase class C family)